MKWLNLYQKFVVIYLLQGKSNIETSNIKYSLLQIFALINE